MHVYIYMYLHVHIYIYRYKIRSGCGCVDGGKGVWARHIYISLYIYVYIYIYTYMSIYIDTDMYELLWIHIRVFTCTHIYRYKIRSGCRFDGGKGVWARHIYTYIIPISQSYYNYITIILQSY
jgi:hypothetical protein